MNYTKKALATQIVLLCAAPQLAVAASFQILEQSPAQLGKAFAGSASDIEDATTVFFNPAGMTELESNSASIGLNLLQATSQFNDVGSNTGGQTSETDETAIVPNLYSVTKLNQRWSLGLGVNAPFGLSSTYDDNWYGRYLATHSELQVLNINATAAFELNPQWSFGFGINYQRMEVTLINAVDSTFGAVGQPSPSTDSSARIKGDDSDFVADLSVLWQPLEALNVGLVWRQGGAFDLSGNAVFALSAACEGTPQCAAGLGALEGDIGATVDLPDTVTLSGSYQINEQWAMHADIAQTKWSSIQTVDILHAQNTDVDGDPLELNSLELLYDDTHRLSVGASYAPQGPWKWRFGVSLDEAPQTDPVHVTPRVPDGDRTWLSAGFNYQWSDALSVDAAFTHIMVDDATIDSSTASMNPGYTYELMGEFDSKVNILALQLNWAY